MKKIIVISCIWLSTVVTHYALANKDSSRFSHETKTSETSTSPQEQGMVKGLYDYIAEILGGEK